MTKVKAARPCLAVRISGIPHPLPRSLAIILQAQRWKATLCTTPSIARKRQCRMRRIAAVPRQLRGLPCAAGRSPWNVHLPCQRRGLALLLTSRPFAGLQRAKCGLCCHKQRSIYMGLLSTPRLLSNNAYVCLAHSSSSSINSGYCRSHLMRDPVHFPD